MPCYLQCYYEPKRYKEFLNEPEHYESSIGLHVIAIAIINCHVMNNAITILNGICFWALCYLLDRTE